MTSHCCVFPWEHIISIPPDFYLASFDHLSQLLVTFTPLLLLI